MRIAGNDPHRLSRTILRLSGASLLAISAVASSAFAGDRAGRDGRCGDGVFAGQGLDGCFKAGSHVRVDSQVMQGAARMTGALPFAEGASPAGMRNDGAPTRLRMRTSGDIFSR